ncbi:MAG TPA: hypothetical protein VM103_01485 [Candidatus Paceibacterota bacterium]|nr:hypothetical protein [Candidatus Paceibacterota bacterium]
MMQTVRIVLLTLLLPFPAFAATSPIATSTFVAEQSVFVATSTPGSLYAFGATVAVTTPTTGDLSAAAGSVVVTAPISGDALLVAGSVSLRASVAGDVRALGGSVSIESPVGGDVLAFGGSIAARGGTARSMHAVGINVTIENGAKGPVTIYANNAALAGRFEGDVTVVAGGRVSLAPDTTIVGSLSYESPEQARIPSSAHVLGGVHYTGPSYLPSSEQAHALVLAGFGVFLFIRFLAAVILAGLIAGLFPRFTDAIAERAFTRTTRSHLLATLLGFAILIAAPVLILLLALTFVGIGIAVLAGALYFLLAILSFISAGIVAGALLARQIEKRDTIIWRDGAFGMLALSVVSLIPVVGMLISGLLIAFAAGTLTVLFFHLVFPKDSEDLLVE